MPLTGSESTLSAALRAAILAEPDIGANDDVPLTKLCDAIAATVLAHLVAQPATVLPTLLVAPPGGGPVTGTGSLT